MAEKTFKLKVITPERLVYSNDIQSIIAKGTKGYLGILPNHAPLLTSLEIGLLTIKDKDGIIEKIALNEGFLEVLNNEVTILTETAETSDSINLKRAAAAKERAQKRLEQGGEGIDRKRAKAALERAEIRLKVKEG